MSNVLPEGMVFVSSKDVWVETGQKNFVFSANCSPVLTSVLVQTT